MNKFWQKGILFVISVVLGIILMIQVQTSGSILGNEKASKKTIDLNNEIASLNIEKNKLRDELEVLRETAKENEDIFRAKELEIEKLSEELRKQKILSGYYDVKGAGTIIRIDAGPDVYVSLASTHQYILALISYLNNAGVEAISINGQRYTNYTEIVPVLDHINVNGVAMVLPLEIKAIGFSRTIDASLNFVGGIVSQLNNIGYTVETESTSEIFINAFDGEKEFKYVNPIEPTESN